MRSEIRDNHGGHQGQRDPGDMALVSHPRWIRTAFRRPWTGGFCDHLPQHFIRCSDSTIPFRDYSGVPNGYFVDGPSGLEAIPPKHIACILSKSHQLSDAEVRHGTLDDWPDSYIAYETGVGRVWVVLYDRCRDHTLAVEASEELNPSERICCDRLDTEDVYRVTIRP